ncbi:MAG: metalloregulator ArsR/SmtB family transcription factor, partial [Actinomycetota bacterium]
MDRHAIATAVDALRALGEPSRLRIVAVLRHGELTVTDLTDVLGQSQPRVSRHLRVLLDAGLIAKHREGSWSFFRLAADAAPLVDDVLSHVDPDDPDVAHDRARLDDVRKRRAAVADEYFEQIAPSWDEERALHAAVDAVEAAIVDAVGDGGVDRLVD